MSCVTSTPNAGENRKVHEYCGWKIEPIVRESPMLISVGEDNRYLTKFWKAVPPCGSAHGWFYAGSLRAACRFICEYIFMGVN